MLAASAMCQRWILQRKFSPKNEAPRGSLADEKRTGSCDSGVDRSVVAQATEWEEPQATRVIL